MRLHLVYLKSMVLLFLMLPVSSTICAAIENAPEPKKIKSSNYFSPICGAIDFLETQEALQLYEMLNQEAKNLAANLVSSNDIEAFFVNQKLTVSKCKEYFGVNGLFYKGKKLTLKDGDFHPDCFSELPPSLAELSFDLVDFMTPQRQTPGVDESFPLYFQTAGGVLGPYQAQLHVWSKYIEKMPNGSSKIQSLSIRLRDEDVDERNFGELGAYVIAESMPLLRKLSLVNTIVRDHGCQVIAQKLKNLIFLDFSENEISSPGVKAIAERLPSLTSLNLSDNNFDLEGISALANQNFHNLVHLSLDGNQIGAEGVSILSFGNFPKLTHLDLNCNLIGSAGAKFLATGNLQELSHLSLVANKIGSEGVQNLVSQNLKKLIYLNLDDNQVDFAGVMAIAQNFKNLTSLSLNNNQIDSAGVVAIAQNLKNLTSLSLYNNQIDAIAAIEIVQNLTKLKELDLGRNNFDIESLGVIAHQLESLKFKN